MGDASLNRVCVFCGSAVGARPEYAEAATALAGELAGRGIGLVYGGGSVGLMGVLADAALAAGVEVIGVIPRGLATRELAHAGLTELRVVASMHERKATMAALSAAFVALPGGLGTLEETLEMLTWSQLGIHSKPVALVDVAGYYAGLQQMLAHAVREGFLRPEYANLVLVAATVGEALDRVARWTPPRLARAWLDAKET